MIYVCTYSCACVYIWVNVRVYRHLHVIFLGVFCEPGACLSRLTVSPLEPPVSTSSTGFTVRYIMPSLFMRVLGTEPGSSCSCEAIYGCIQLSSPVDPPLTHPAEVVDHPASLVTRGPCFHIKLKIVAHKSLVA